MDLMMMRRILELPLQVRWNHKHRCFIFLIALYIISILLPTWQPSHHLFNLYFHHQSCHPYMHTNCFFCPLAVIKTILTHANALLCIYSSYVLCFVYLVFRLFFFWKILSRKAHLFFLFVLLCPHLLERELLSFISRKSEASSSVIRATRKDITSDLVNTDASCDHACFFFLELFHM